MKSLIVSAWLATVWLLNSLGGIMASLSAIDWSQVGWAFAGSTAYVLYEIVNPKPTVRSGWHRFFLIAIGMVVSLSANTYVSEKTGLPIQMVSTALGALGYKLFTLGQKRADKPGELIKDLTQLNDEKP